MPELPEVETIRLQLAKLLPGLKIKEIRVLAEKSFSGNGKDLFGTEITGLRRFGKMLIIDMDKDLVLAVHLKMTGQLIYGKSQKDKLPDKYTRVIVSFTDGSRLFFNDLRKFGWMRVFKKSQIGEVIGKIGPDPLETNSSNFYKILESSRKPVKLLLMDQTKLAGVGNIYANEALFLTKINPKKEANKIKRSEVDSLLTNLKKVLQQGIKFGGASDKNYLDAYGKMGEMQEHFLVYGREGEECVNNCGETVKKIKMGGRGTYFCPRCQK